MSFGLKGYINEMNKLGFIELEWDTDGYSNGMAPMIDMFQCLKGEPKRIEETDIFKNTIKYNEVDCKSVYEIVNYLRQYHI